MLSLCCCNSIYYMECTCTLFCVGGDCACLTETSSGAQQPGTGAFVGVSIEDSPIDFAEK